VLKAGEAQSPAALSYKHSRKTTLRNGWKGINGKVRGEAGGISGGEWEARSGRIGARGARPGNRRGGRERQEGVEPDE
jgi:hypothetical protein